jgi:hypothetical protein
MFNTIIWGIQVVFAGFLVLGIHETGHLLTGLFQGFEFQKFVIGPLGIEKRKGKITCYLNLELSSYGGMAATTPKKFDSDTAVKFGRILLAGPLASLLFGLSTLGYHLIVHTDNPFILIGGAMSLGIFFATTIPNKSGVYFSDRKRYQRLTGRGKERDVELAVLKMSADFNKSDSYRSVDVTDILTITSDESGFMKAYGLLNLICYQYETQHKAGEQVLDEFEKLTESLPKSLRRAFANELLKYKNKADTLFYNG